MFTGMGGQTAFAIAACLAGGKSIIALPASSIVNGERLSRIVPVLAPGTVVTTPCTFVDYVVEVVSIGVEKEASNLLFSGDGCWFLFLPHSLCQANSSSSALASLRSVVSNPSVNQP